MTTLSPENQRHLATQRERMLPVALVVHRGPNRHERRRDAVLARRAAKAKARLAA